MTEKGDGMTSGQDVRDAMADHEVEPVGQAIAEQLERSLRAEGFDVTVTFEGDAAVLRDREGEA
jgi:hypothetical protein